MNNPLSGRFLLALALACPYALSARHQAFGAQAPWPERIDQRDDWQKIEFIDESFNHRTVWARKKDLAAATDKAPAALYELTQTNKAPANKAPAEPKPKKSKKPAKPAKQEEPAEDEPLKEYSSRISQYTAVPKGAGKIQLLRENSLIRESTLDTSKQPATQMQVFKPVAAAATVSPLLSAVDPAALPLSDRANAPTRQRLLPIEFELLDNGLTDPKSAEQAAAAKQLPELGPATAWAKSIRAALVAVVKDKLSKDISQDFDKFTPFETKFLARRFMGLGKLPLWKKELDAAVKQPETLHAFVYKWRAFTHSELALYTAEAEKANALAETSGSGIVNYKASLDALIKRTDDALNNANMEAVYARAKMSPDWKKANQGLNAIELAALESQPAAPCASAKPTKASAAGLKPEETKCWRAKAAAAVTAYLQPGFFGKLAADDFDKTFEYPYLGSRLGDDYGALKAAFAAATDKPKFVAQIREAIKAEAAGYAKNGPSWDVKLAKPSLREALGLADPTDPSATAALSAYEVQAANALGLTAKPAPPAAGNQACINKQAACRDALASQLKRSLDALSGAEKDKFGPFELSYLKERLGPAPYEGLIGKDTDDKRSALSWAKENGTLPAFVARWRAAIASEITAYLKPENVKNRGAYDPSKTTANVVDALKKEPRAPVGDLGRLLAKILPGDDPKTWAARMVIEARHAADFEKDPKASALAKLAAMPAGAERDAEVDKLKLAAISDARAYLADPGALPRLSGILSQNGMTDDNLLESYCPPPQEGQALNPGQKEEKAMKQAEAAKAGLTTQAKTGSEADGGAGTFDNKGAPTLTDKLMARCEKYRKDKILKAARQQDNPTPGVGNYKGLDNIDVPSGVIGQNTGQTVPPKPDPNSTRDMIAGAKLGILAAVLGGIFLGPVGFLALGVAGVALGMWMSKDANK